MATKKIRLHIICGFCGSNDDFKFCIEFDDDRQSQVVYVTCQNCACLTSLDEVIETQEAPRPA